MFENPLEEFEEFFGGGTSKRFASTYYRPPMDVIETDDRYVVTMEIPGLSKDNIKIVLEGNLLRIEGYRPRNPLCDEEKNATFVHSEIHYGHFQRKVEFPHGTIDRESIKSKYSNGFLIIDVPKKKPKEIEIELED